MGKRSESDEFYVIDLCDELFAVHASRHPSGRKNGAVVQCHWPSYSQ
jgi:hypothetical protein